MMTIYLVPIGKTDYSQNGELLGINNPPLSPAGKSHADDMAEALRPIVLEAVFSGPLKREVNTAERIAAPHSIPVRTEADLKDINYGSWSGLTWQKIEGTEAQLLAKLRQSPQKFRFPVGEKIKKSGKRVQSFVGRILANYGTGNLVIVADDFMICMLASQMAKIELSRLKPWKPSQGKMSIIECDERSCAIKSLYGMTF
jgi:broad specificity phosphatase PhoE